MHRALPNWHNINVVLFAIDDDKNRQLVTQFSRAQDNTCTTQNNKTLGEYRCGTSQKPSDG